MNDTQTPAQVHRCSQCSTIVDAQDRFCRSCGLGQGVDAAAVASLIARILPERIDAVLKERFRDQKLVELETAELVAERAIKWLKTLGFFFGIPFLAVVAIFSFVGIKTWSDVQNVASQTFDLQKTLTEPKQRLAQAVQDIERLRVNLAEAKTSLDKSISNVQNDFDAYRNLRAQLSSSETGKPNQEIIDYINDILGPQRVPIAFILRAKEFAGLRQKISACITARAEGHPCKSGSLAEFLPR